MTNTNNKLYDYPITKNQLESIFLLTNKNIDFEYIDRITILDSYIYTGYINNKSSHHICIKYIDEKNKNFCLSCELSKIVES